MTTDPKIPYKIYLEENEMPQAWYNVRADMHNKPAPLLNPGTGLPMTAEELEPVFCRELVRQELDDTTAYIPIPTSRSAARSCSRRTSNPSTRMRTAPTRPKPDRIR